MMHIVYLRVAEAVILQKIGQARINLNQAAQQLILAGLRRPARNSDFDEFSGIWTKEEEGDFEEILASMRKEDEADWK